MRYAIPLFECLEERRFLSAAAMTAGVQPATSASSANATGIFSGVLTLHKTDESGRKMDVLTLDVASQDAAGNIAGTLSGTAFGNTTFSGGQVGAGKGGVPLSLSFSGDRSGTLTAKLNTRNVDRLVGSVTDAAGRKLGTIRLFRFDDVAMTSAPSTSSAANTSTDTGVNASTGLANGASGSGSTVVIGTNVNTMPAVAAGVPTTRNVVQTVTNATTGTTTTTTTTTIVSTAGTVNTPGSGNAVITQTPLLGPGSVGGGVPDGSVNVTLGPDISTAAGGGAGSGLDISTGGNNLNGPPVNAPDGSVDVTSGSPDISTGTGGGAGSGIDISVANGNVNGPPINSATTAVDTSSSGVAGTTTTTTMMTTATTGASNSGTGSAVFNTGGAITDATVGTTTSAINTIVVNG